jgi:hypothetical protein
MREKLLWSIVALLAVMLVLAHAQTPAQSGSQVGRYQIVTVAGDSKEDAQAFKIDTVTGKTWGQAFDMSGGTKAIVWAVIPDHAAPK